MPYEKELKNFCRLDLKKPGAQKQHVWRRDKVNFHKRINGWASRRRKRRAAARVGVANTFFLSVRRPNISHYFLRAVHLECCCGGGARGLIRRRFWLCSRRQIWVAAAPRWRSINSSARRNERAVWWRSPSLSTAPSSGGGSKNYTYAGEMTSWSIGQMTIKNRRHVLSLFRYCFLLPCQVVTLTRASIATIYHGRRRGNDMKMEVALFSILKCLWLCAFKGHKWVRNTLA